MPVYVPNPNQPRRTGRMESIGAILTAPQNTGPRITLKGNYREPSLPFPARMHWLANVQRLTADHSRERKSYPHKTYAVAAVIAHVGNVCRLSLEGIASRAGCVVSTVEACIAWLEEQGAITWSHTARMHSNGRHGAISNLYTLITNFNGLVATVAKAIRAIWREGRFLPSPHHRCHGLTQPVSYQEQEAAAETRLAEVNKDASGGFTGMPDRQRTLLHYSY